MSMNVSGNITGKSPKLNSVLVKTVLIAALMTLAVVVTKTLLDSQGKRELMLLAKADRIVNVTDLLALQSGGAIKFGNEAAVAATMTGVLDTAQPDMTGALVVTAGGVVVYATDGANIETPENMVLVQRALDTGEMVSSEDRMTVASLAPFGNDNAIVGVVLTSWTQEHTLAALRRNELQSLAASGVVFLLALVGNIFFLRSMIARPLDSVGQAMAKVADKKFDLSIPYTGRGDEIGAIAGSLEEFRGRLASAESLQREAAFKGAAFEGSSAPMMMVDQDRCIKFLNPKCGELLESLMPELGEIWPKAKDGAWVGLNFGDLLDLTDTQTDSAEGVGQAQSLRVGDRDISIQIGPAHDEQNRPIGAVIELSDRTIEQRNAAVLHGIDGSQMRVDFDVQGLCLSMNSVAAKRLSGQSGDLIGTSLHDLLHAEQPEQSAVSEIVTSVMSGKAFHQKLSFKAQDGAMVFVDAGFVPVRTNDGKLERVILLGTDITRAEQQMLAAKQEQTRVSQEQGMVVEALGMGLKQLSQGDLSHELATVFPTDYEELRSNFNLAITSLRSTIGQVSQNVDSIRNETSEITTAADDLSRRTERQAATLEETAAALDELTSSVHSAADGADAANKMSAEAKANAEQGGVVASQAMKAMDEIKASSEKISKIISVIDDIAFQTNLLALNAGVEAARAGGSGRAGEAGRGFAVVATEVRALAQRSSDAAREINALITNSAEQVRQGVDLVDKTGSALASIVSSVSEISERVAEIASSAREQSSGLNEINVAMNELDQVTQQNAAMFEETTAASHALTSEADSLATAVAAFNLGNSFKSAAVTPKASGGVSSKPAETRSVPAMAVSGSTALAMQPESNPAADAGWEEF